MSYTDLSGMKRINGEPADLRYFIELNENDAFLKNAVDTDEDLESLDRHILPNANEQFDLGTNSTRFRSGYFNHLISNLLTLPNGGTVINPTVLIGDAGLSNISTGELSIITNGFEPLKANSSGVLIKAANNSVLKLQNTNPSSASQWSLGTDETGLTFSDLTSGSIVKALFSQNYTALYNSLRLASGSEMNPAISFNDDPTTGIYKDISSPVLNFGISGETKASLSSAALSLLNQLTISSGSNTEPSLSFNDNLTTGLSLVSNSLAVVNAGKLSHVFGSQGTRTISEVEINSSTEVYNDTFGIMELFKKAGGTESIPTELVENTDLWIQRIQGYTDTGFQTVAEISSTTTEDYDSGAYGAMLSFSTTTVGQNEATEKLQIGSSNGASVNVLESFGLAKIEVEAGLNQEIDVSAISKVLINGTSGNVEIRGFTGGKEGQMLYIYKKVPTNSFTLIFNSASASQKVLLKGSTNFVNTNDYGGITLSFDDGIWREVSRS